MNPPRPLSDSARSTLVEHLERTLCDPAAMAAHVRNLGPDAAQRAVDDWDGDRLQQLLEDDRRLELFDNDELQRLSADPVGLIALGEEVTLDWWPAWNEPLAAAGRAWRERAGLDPPAWDDLELLRAEGATESESLAKAELVGSMGEVLERASESKGRALLLEWAWSRPRGRLGVPGGSAAESRLTIKFRLQAYARRLRQNGGWVLTISGEPPEDLAANLIASLSGWGGNHVDRTERIDLGPGTTEIALGDFPDPTPIFAGWASGSAMIEVACGGSAPWQASEPIPGPELDRAFFENWVKDPDHGLDACLARLVAYFQRSGKIRDHQLIYQALEEAAREIYRHRYVYREIRSYADFSRLVVEAARRRYRQTFRGLSQKVSPIGAEPVALGSSPESALAGAELRAALDVCLERLPDLDRGVVELRRDDELPFQAIGDRLDLTEGTSRVRYHRALRKLAECLNLKGYGPENLIVGR